MIIDFPTDTAPLRTLWKQAFGDPDTFLDSFFSLGYAPTRCRQLTVDGKLASVVYWFDCSLNGKKIAYLYAAATDKVMRGRGFCRTLMADTHRHLRTLGYESAVLVPASPSLFGFYEKMGYRTFGGLHEITCKAGMPIPVRQLSTEEYAAARHVCLPDGGIVQENAFLEILKTQVDFYKTDSSVFCAYRQADTLFVPELLGDLGDAGGIVAALGAKKGHLRTIGTSKPFAMYLPLTEHTTTPGYFGLALDDM